MLTLHAIYNALTIEQITKLMDILESYGMLDQIIDLINFTYYKHGDRVGNEILELCGNDKPMKPYPVDNLNHIVVQSVPANVLKLIAIMPITMFESVMKATKSDMIKSASDYEKMEDLYEQFIFLTNRRDIA